MALSQAALTTLDAVKAALGITSLSQDSAIERVIESASAAAANYVGRPLHRVDGIVEAVRGYASNYLMVSRSPIVSVTSVAYDGSTVDPTSYEIDSSDASVLYAPDGWVWTGVVGAGAVGIMPLPGTERRLYTVTYDGGYVTPNQVDLGSFDEVGPPIVTKTRTLPYDLEEAVIKIATDMWQRLGRDDAVIGEALLSGSVNYSVTGMGMGPIGAYARSLLDPYRRLVIA